jgi:hypothetical protein
MISCFGTTCMTWNDKACIKPNLFPSFRVQERSTLQCLDLQPHIQLLVSYLPYAQGKKENEQ